MLSCTHCSNEVLRKPNVDSPFELLGMKEHPNNQGHLQTGKGKVLAIVVTVGMGPCIVIGQEEYIWRNLSLPLAFWGFLIPEPGLQCG